MPYATRQDLIDRFTESEIAQVADSDGSGEIDEVRLARALVDADAEIDSALIGRYSLPLTNVPDLLTSIACDIARDFLYSDHRPEIVTDNAKRARALLDGIASGKRRLDVAAAAQEVSGLGLVEIVSGRRKTPFVG